MGEPPEIVTASTRSYLDRLRRIGQTAARKWMVLNRLRSADEPAWAQRARAGKEMDAAKSASLQPRQQRPPPAIRLGLRAARDPSGYGCRWFGATGNRR